MYEYFKFKSVSVLWKFDFKQEKFAIQVTITGQRHFVKINFYDPIKSIKDKISMKMGVSSAMLKLEYDGQILKDNYYIYDYTPHPSPRSSLAPSIPSSFSERI